MKLKDLTGIVEGVVYGDREFEIKSILPPEEARESDLTFLFDAKASTNAGVIIGSEKIESKNGIVVRNVKQAMFLLLRHLGRHDKPKGISQHSIVDKDVHLAKSCTVEPYAVIGRNTIVGNNSYIGAHCFIDEQVVIGDNCEIHPNVTVYARTKIGNFVSIGANSVIGKEGFGYFKSGKYERIRHIGGVIIEDFVELGGNVTVDRGTIGDTVIAEGTKVDNLVHIAHNVKIGKNCLIMGQSGIAGSSRLGNNVVLCGQVGISDHLEIEDDVVVYAKSGVFKTLKKSREYSGIPAREHSAVLRAIARLYGSSQAD